MKFRTATVEDIPLLVKLRRQELTDENFVPPNNDMDPYLPSFFERHLTDGSMVQWVCEDQGEIIATSAIVFYEMPPSFTNGYGWIGYIANVYTAAAYRRRGIATALLERVVQEAKVRNVKLIWLRASEEGTFLYEKYGFSHGNDWMRLELP